MLDKTTLLIKYFFYGVFFLLLGVVLYQISIIEGDASFQILNYVIYTQTSVLFSIFLILFYFLIKLFLFLSDIKILFYKIRFNISNKIQNFKSKASFNEAEALNKILKFKINGQYKDGLKFTSSNLYASPKCFFWNLFFLLKLKKDKEFFKLFMQKPSGVAIRMFNLIYLPRNIKFFKTFFLKRLYFKNLHNQVIAYIYANYLFSNHKVKEAKIVLNQFLNEKKIFMTDEFCSYLMNLLAIKIEYALEGVSSQDFISYYQDNIEFYHGKKK